MVLNRLRRGEAADVAADRPGGPADLACRGVEVSYGSVQVLFGVDLDVRSDEIVALLGTNGAGKSTLLKAVSGLVAPTAGTIHFGGRDITGAGAATVAKAGIIQVPGGKAVFPTLTVAEHFRAGGWLSTDPDDVVQARVDDVLERFPRLKERWDQHAGNLSGGEQQQLALGMAFAVRPRLLIIDELSLGLAPSVVQLLLEMVRAIHEQGCPVVLVEQSVNVALTVASRAYFMEKGEVRFSGPTAELLDRGDLLRSVFLEGAARGGQAKQEPIVTRDRPAAQSATNEPALQVDGLSKSFGGVAAVRDVSFRVEPHQILGLIGPNGAGKTTIFDLVSGILPADSGNLRLGSHDITAWGAARRAAAGLGRSFQDARIFPALSVTENIALALERHLEHRDHIAAMLALPAIREMEEEITVTVDRLIELMGLDHYRDTVAAQLSTGTRRVVDLAMSLAHDPDVLLLDEPSSGIAQRETEALTPLLLRIREETGCALLVIEHDMPLLTSICDEMIALELGAVATQGQPADVLRDPRVVSSYLGGDLSTINRSGAVVKPPARSRRRRVAS